MTSPAECTIHVTSHDKHDMRRVKQITRVPSILYIRGSWKEQIKTRKQRLPRAIFGAREPGRSLSGTGVRSRHRGHARDTANYNEKKRTRALVEDDQRSRTLPNMTSSMLW